MSAGGILGAVAGFFIGGPQGAMYGYSIGSALGSYIDPPKGPHLEGPRLSDLSVQTSTYGAVIPRGYGTFALSGNVFWLENNRLKEVATTTTTESGGKGGGGSTATQTTYAYYATFAVGLCEGPIIGVRRIWVGPKLIFDASAADLSQLSASADAASMFSIHYGTDIQLADDRMQATLGVADVPAYRGLAYLVFKDYPLAEHGNSLLGAQVKAEVVVTGAISPISFVAAAALQSSLGSLGPRGYFWQVQYTGQQLIRVHVPSGTIAARTSRQRPDGGMLVPIGFSANGTCLATQQHTGYSDIVMIRPSGEQIDIGTIAPVVGGDVSALGTGDDTWVLNLPAGLSIFNAAAGTVAANAPSGQYNPIAGGAVAGRWVYFRLAIGLEQSLIRFDPVTNIYQHLFQLNIYDYGGLQDSRYYARVVFDGTTFYVYDIVNNTIAKFSLDGTLLATGASGLGIPTMYHPNGKIVCRDGSTWKVCAADTLAVESGYTTQDLGLECVDPFNSGSMSVSGKVLVVVDAPAPGTTTLASIVASEAVKSNLLSPGDIDASALTQSVRGYRIGRVSSIRSAIEPLQGAFPFDLVQHGYQIKCVPRGGSSVAVVPAADLDAKGVGQAPGVAVTLVREMDSVLPSRVTLKFLDADREYADNEQYAERLNTSAVNVRSIDMPMVLTATEAAQIVERLLYLYWLERYDVRLNLPPTYNQIEPADVIMVIASEGTYNLRLTKITYTADGRLECDAKYNAAAIYLSTAQGEAGLSTGTVVAYLGDTDFQLLDIPLLIDSMDRPGFVAAMTGLTSGWPGGVLYTTSDEGQTWSSVQGFAPPSCVIGIALAAIGSGRTDLMDKSSQLRVALRNGDLASVSESSLFNGANHFAYGADGRWEIIGAQTCVLQADDTYIFSDLLRGRFGTEWACGLHGANDTIVALDTARVAFIGQSVNLIGALRTYRAVTAGKSLSTGTDLPFTYTGVNLECLSPVYLNGNRNPSTNDWSLDWIRRTRVGGEWRDYVDAPLSESAQSYEVDIFADGSYATLKRTLSGLTTPAATYTSAQQVIDFGSNQATLYVKVYQLSADVGRGYPLTTSITR